MVDALPARISLTRRRTVGLAAASVITTLFLVRLLGAGWREGFPVFFPDSSSYLQVARLGPFRPSFWFGERPVITPLFLWAGARNIRVIVLAQSLVYVGAFWWAIAVMWRIARTAIGRWSAVVLIVAVAVQPRFALWNTHVLSESLGISLGVATIATWLWFVHRPTVGRVTSAWVVTALWALTRDSNVVVTVTVAVPAALVAARTWRAVDPAVRRALRTGALAMGLVLLFVLAGQSASGRNQYPTLNVIGQRVLVDDDLTEYYVGLGMPLGDALRERAGRSSFDDGSQFLLDPALDDARMWAASRGQLAQLSSMVWFAPRFVRTVWDDMPAQVATKHQSYDLFGVGERLPNELPFGIDGPATRMELIAWGLAAVLSLGAMVGSGRRVRHGVLLAIALLATAGDLYLSWLGDSVEVQRHLVGAIARLGLLLVMIVSSGVDEIVHPGEPAAGPAAEPAAEPALEGAP